MQMSPPIRKLMLAGHLSVSVGWIGAVLAYLVLGAAAASSGDIQTARAAWTAMEITGWYAIVPLSLASLLTGLVMAWGTSWGLIRHYWVLISLVITMFATGVLLLHMPDVSHTADLAQTAGRAQLDTMGGDFFHAGFGLALLLMVQVLNVYKPRGLTRYGWRKQQESRHRQQTPQPTPLP